MAGDTAKVENGEPCPVCGKRPGKFEMMVDGKPVYVCERCWRKRQWAEENGKTLCSECGKAEGMFIIHKTGEPERVVCAACAKKLRRWRVEK